MLFLQAAGADFGLAHDLVDAVSEASREASDSRTPTDSKLSELDHVLNHHKILHRLHSLDFGRLEERLGAVDWGFPERALLSMAVYATLAAPISGSDVGRIAAATASLSDPALALEITGVVFAFNSVNRVADARRVRLEFRWLRGMETIGGWVERRFATLTGLAYDLSYVHQPRHEPGELLRRLEAMIRRRGASDIPDLFLELRPSPQVLEGIFEMLDVLDREAGIRTDLWTEAVSIATASLATAGSGLRRMTEVWLDRASLPDAESLLAAASSDECDPGLVATCRRYAWKVSNAAYTVTDEEIRRLRFLGLSDAEVLDLTLAASLFSALAIVEPLISAVTTAPVTRPPRD